MRASFTSGEAPSLWRRRRPPRWRASDTPVVTTPRRFLHYAGRPAAGLHLGGLSLIGLYDLCMSISVSSFQADPHAVTYVRVLDENPAQRDRFFELLNDKCNEHRLVDTEELGRPTLAGIVRFLDTDAAVGPVGRFDASLSPGRRRGCPTQDGGARLGQDWGQGSHPLSPLLSRRAVQRRLSRMPASPADEAGGLPVLQVGTL